MSGRGTLTLRGKGREQDSPLLDPFGTVAVEHGNVVQAARERSHFAISYDFLWCGGGLRLRGRSRQNEIGRNRGDRQSEEEGDEALVLGKICSH